MLVARIACPVYNASGDPLTIYLHESWRGSFYKNSPPTVVQNGQWITFFHVHPMGAAEGSRGAVVYRTAADSNIFIGWQNPWKTLYMPNANSCCGRNMSGGI